jgi:Cep192 domain 4
MKTKLYAILCVAVSLLALLGVSAPARAQGGYLTYSGVITTVAGNGTPGFSGDGGPATQAELGGSFLSGIVMDAAGNLYICDSGNARIRKVDPSGIITTFAGNGTPGYTGDGGPATSATINGASGIVVDSAGNVYFSEFNNLDIREVNTSGTISTYASLPSKPTGIAIDPDNNIYVALYSQNEILKVAADSTHTQTVVAGNGFAGYSGDGGLATDAELNNPNGIFVLGSGAGLSMYISDDGNDVIRIVSDGNISTIAGNGTAGYSGDGGPATDAQLNDPAYGVTVDPYQPQLPTFIADDGNNVIRSMAFAYNEQSVVTIACASAVVCIQTQAGTGAPGYSGDGGPAWSAQLNHPEFLTIGTDGVLYISDTYNNVVRKVQYKSLDFGTVSLGQSSTLIGGFKNTGTAPVNFSSISVNGDFSVQGGGAGSCSTAAPLDPGSSCTVTLVYTPSVVGRETGALTLVDDSLSPDQSLPLSGTGRAYSSFTTPQQIIATGITMAFSQSLSGGNTISQTVLVPSGSNLGGAAYMAASFQQWSPTVFNTTRLPATSTNLWSGGAPVPSGASCTPISGAGGNCMVVEDLCFDSNHNPITPCNITAASGSQINFSVSYQTLSSQPNPALLIATDQQNDWANVTTTYVPPYVYAEGKSNNSDFAVVNLPSYNACLLYDPDVAAKSGSTIPLKLYLCDTSGNDLSGPNIALHASSVVLVGAATTDDVEDSGNANPDSDFRFDSTLGPSGGYIFNLQTKGLSTGTYSLQFTAGTDTAIHSLKFQVK